METVRSDTKLAQVMGAIRRRIDNRQLTPGARIPSIRAMAEALSVSKATVVEAYERLAAEGAIAPRPGSGFYVAAPLAPLRVGEIGRDTDPTVDPLWVMRQSLRRGGASLRPGCGWLPDHWMPQEALRRAFRSLARDGDGPSLFEYGPPQGSETLRGLIARRLLDHGIEAAPDQVMTTDSGTHAIDLVCRFLLEPGDTVLVDDPCYFNFHTLLRAHRVRAVGVPFTPSGPDVAALAQVLETERPRLYITNSALHNPTGFSLTAAVAHRVLKLAEAHDLVIVEDDVFEDLEVEPAPRLAAFDGLDRVIRVGSFSKTLSASVRCGHIAARPDWIAGLADLRLATGLGSRPHDAELVAAVLRDGGYRRHLDQLKARLARRRERGLDRLAALGLEVEHPPRAGMFLWARLPEGVEAAAVARHGLQHDVVFAPGGAFSLGDAADRHLRFNVAQMDDPRIDAVLKAALA